jgi:hypothetical protein
MPVVAWEIIPPWMAIVVVVAVPFVVVAGIYRLLTRNRK